MKIVYLNPSGQLGGAELALLDLLASVREAEPEWPLHLIAGADGPLIARAESLGVGASVLPFPHALARLGDAGAGGPAGTQLSRAALLKKLFSAGSPVLKYVSELRRLLHELKPDVIHSNGFKMHVLAARARPRNSMPLIWHVRDYVTSRPLMARLLRWHMKRCAAAITNSKSVAEDLRRACGDDLKIYPVLDAIDLEKFTPDGARLDLDALSHLPAAEAGTLRIGLLATMARWKGHTTFLRALARLPAGLKFRGYIIGGALYQTEGSQHTLEELRGEAQRLKLSDRVGFTGFVLDAASAMRALDVVVHASTEPEPFGLVIAEAMASGRALIASEAGGAAEIINAGTDALAHEPGDAEALAACLERLVTDAALRQRLGEAGRLTAEHEFDRARLATELIPIYLKTLASEN
ncbi:MAG TPA: glycosyltransferase family 4 protein [Pyrinomonadaceae bacterium]|jgi:glycosyltransferase involved in cell wall biosynthesis